MKLRYGLEIEWADFDNTKIPPPGWIHSEMELSIVNSNGTATHPGVNPRGGEINSPVFDSLNDVKHSLDELVEIFSDAKVNHREALHIHLSCEEFFDLKNLKKLVVVLNSQIPKILNHIYNPFEKNRYWCPTVQRRIRWWEPWQHDLLLQAESIEDFIDCFHKTKNGDTYKGPPRRYAVNLSALSKHKTIEFRLFPATTKVEEIMNAILVSENLVEHAIEQVTLLNFRNFQLPAVSDFSKVLEEGWIKTNVHGRHS